MFAHIQNRFFYINASMEKGEGRGRGVTLSFVFEATVFGAWAIRYNDFNNLVALTQRWLHN
jgi:hypothetical protein